MKQNIILQGESIATMQNLASNSFDFIFADPPYFMQLNPKKQLLRSDGSIFQGCNDEWDKFDSMEAYKQFTYEWLNEARRLLKPNGTICIIAGMQSLYEIGSLLRELGFWVLNEIVWHKSNPTPNFNATRLANAHETIIWAAKSKQSKITFNYHTGKILNNGKQMTSIWNFPVCSGAERLKDDAGQKLHNTQKPLALLHRIMVLFTNPGDFVLDPFGGTMTTGVVAKQTGRNYLMIEREPKYIKYGTKRLENTKLYMTDIEAAVADLKPLKITLSEMIESGFLTLNEDFYYKNQVVASLATQQGYLNYLGKVLSMHQVASLLEDKAGRLNGYTKFFVKRNNTLISLNEIREQARDFKKKKNLV